MYPTFRTEVLILVNFLSVKPHIPFAQELQQVQVLVGQIEHEEPLPRDVEHMNPHKVVEDPPCSGGLDALAFLVRKGGLVLLERVAWAEARLSRLMARPTPAAFWPYRRERAITRNKLYLFSLQRVTDSS